MNDRGGERRKMAGLLKKHEVEDSISHERLYYRIGEVSRLTGLKPHVLRYWESEFRVIRPHKGGSSQRLYRRKDLDLILKIKKLLYEDGFTIAGAKKKIRDLERFENKQMKLRPIEKGSDENAHEFLVAVQEELKGIRDMLE